MDHSEFRPMAAVSFPVLVSPAKTKENDLRSQRNLNSDYKILARKLEFFLQTNLSLFSSNAPRLNKPLPHKKQP